MRLLRRMPAVSTKRIGPSSVSTTVSTLSRVVPGTSCTTERSSPMRRLNSGDLPTFGRPTMATAGTSGSVGADVSSTFSGSRRRSTTASRRSPVPRPCSALTGNGSPSPRRANPHASASRPESSTLLATTRTCLSDLRRRLATRSSSSVTPMAASTTRRTTSASLMARSACRLTWASMPSWAAIHPPVSTSRNSRPFQSASRIFRSRVTPGRSSTIASRRPTIRLTNVDLPTLGRPTTATRGSVICRHECAAKGDAVGGDDLDLARQVGRCGAVEEGAIGKAHVGQQIAVVLGFVAQHAGDVLTDQETGDADVAAEELVADRQDAYVVSSHTVEQRPQHLGAVLARDDRDRSALLPVLAVDNALWSRFPPPER